MFLDRSWPIRGGAADIYMPLTGSLFPIGIETQSPIPVCLDGTIIDSSTILVTTTRYVLLWLCCGMIGGCAW